MTSPGGYEREWEVTDACGSRDRETQYIQIVDTTRPTVQVTASSHRLWPANHAYVAVSFTVDAQDACTPSEQLQLSVLAVSDQPDNGPGDGNTTGDVNGGDGYTAPVDVTSDFYFDPESGTFMGTVGLRAERAGSEQRTYTITFSVNDESGRVKTKKKLVRVAPPN